MHTNIVSALQLGRVGALLLFITDILSLSIINVSYEISGAYFLLSRYGKTAQGSFSTSNEMSMRKLIARTIFSIQHFEMAETEPF